MGFCISAEHVVFGTAGKENTQTASRCCLQYSLFTLMLFSRLSLPAHFPIAASDSFHDPGRVGPSPSQREGGGPASCPEAFTPQHPKDLWHMQPAIRLRELPSDCRGSGRPHARGPRHPQMARDGGRARELGPGAAVRSRAQLLLTPPSAALSARQHGAKKCVTAKRQACLKSGDRSV